MADVSMPRRRRRANTHMNRNLWLLSLTAVYIATLNLNRRHQPHLQGEQGEQGHAADLNALYGDHYRRHHRQRLHHHPFASGTPASQSHQRRYLLLSSSSSSSPSGRRPCILRGRWSPRPSLRRLLGGSMEGEEVSRLCSELEAAVDCQLSPYVSNEQRSQASMFVDSLLAHPLGWQVAVCSLRRVMCSSARPSLQLWALQALRIWIRKAIERADIKRPRNDAHATQAQEPLQPPPPRPIQPSQQQQQQQQQQPFEPPKMLSGGDEDDEAEDDDEEDEKDEAVRIEPPEFPSKAAMMWKDEVFNALRQSDGMQGVMLAVRNKYALVVGLLMKWLFPSGIWPDAFNELIGLTQGGTIGSIDFVLRTLDAVDELGVDKQFFRTRSDHALSSIMKDNMRGEAITKIAGLCKTILANYHNLGDAGKGLELARFSLSILAKYVDWSDIHTYIDGPTLSLLHQLHSTVPPLRGGVARLMSAMLHKGMSGEKRLALAVRIRALDIVLDAARVMEQKLASSTRPDGKAAGGDDTDFDKDVAEYMREAAELDLELLNTAVGQDESGTPLVCIQASGAANLFAVLTGPTLAFLSTPASSPSPSSWSASPRDYQILAPALKATTAVLAATKDHSWLAASIEQGRPGVHAAIIRGLAALMRCPDGEALHTEWREEGRSMKTGLEDIGHYEFREAFARPMWVRAYHSASLHLEEGALSYIYSRGEPLGYFTDNPRDAEALLTIAADTARLVMTLKDSAFSPPLPRAQKMLPALERTLSAGVAASGGVRLFANGVGGTNTSAVAFEGDRHGSSHPAVCLALHKLILAMAPAIVTSERLWRLSPNGTGLHRGPQHPQQQQQQLAQQNSQLLQGHTHVLSPGLVYGVIDSLMSSAGLMHPHEPVRVSASIALNKLSSFASPVVLARADALLNTISRYINMNSKRPEPPKELQHLLTLASFFVKHSRGDILPMLVQTPLKELDRVLVGLQRGIVGNTQTYGWIGRTLESLSSLFKEAPNEPQDLAKNMARNVLGTATAASEVLPPGQTESRAQVLRLFQAGVRWLGSGIVLALPSIVEQACAKGDWYELSLLYPLLTRILLTIPDAKSGMQELLRNYIGSLVRKAIEAMPMQGSAFRQDRIDLLNATLKFLGIMAQQRLILSLLNRNEAALLMQMLRALCTTAFNEARSTRKSAVALLNRLYMDWIIKSNSEEIARNPEIALASETLERYIASEELNEEQKQMIMTGKVGLKQGKIKR